MLKDIETGGAWGNDANAGQAPGLLMQTAAPAAPAPKTAAGPSSSRGPAAAAVPAAVPDAKEEESTGLLSKMFKKKKQTPGTEEEAPPKTLKQRFREKKAVALVGILISVLVGVFAFFLSGGIFRILNMVAGGAGVVGGLVYFFASTINAGTRVLFACSGIVVAIAFASIGYNIYWLVTNFSSLGTWVSIPFTIIMCVALGTQAYCIGDLGWRGWRVHRGKVKAQDMQQKAARFAASVG